MKLKDLSILISEDEPDVAEHLAAMIRNLGHYVAGIARDGREAVAMTREIGPDLLIMDINLPDMDGLEAIRQILERESLPVVISSGRSDNEVFERLEGLGVQAWLSKPFSESQLKSTLSLAMMQFAMQAKAREKIETLKGAAGELPIERLGEIGLTKRESEVLFRISQGKSNSEIARELGGSPRTVAKHVEHIFLKLGVDSRTAAVAEAHRLVGELV